ncbi:MAG: MraY family glycosyltransferase [Patescibacteria group bacterium]
MALYYLSAAASFAVSFLLVTLLKTYAAKRQLFMTEIRPRDIHSQPTPRVGGIAVVVSFLLVVLTLYVVNPAWFNFVNQTIWGVDRNFLGLIVAVLVLAAVSAVDDYKTVPWPYRLATQIAAAALIVGFGVKIPWLNNPFGDLLVLSGGLGGLFVIVWLVGLANIVNWLDSTDGLAGGVSAIALAVLFFLSVSPEVAQSENALIGAVAFGSVVGFLPHNFMKKKAFLGDTGTMFLGFIIGVMAIISGGKVATAFLVLAIPFLDAIVVFFSRVFSHQSPFLPDQRHLPHRLLALGLKVWQVNLIYYSFSLLFGLIALNTQTIGKLNAVVLALAVMAALVLLYSGKMGALKTTKR